MINVNEKMISKATLIINTFRFLLQFNFGSIKIANAFFRENKMQNE